MRKICVRFMRFFVFNGTQRHEDTKVFNDNPNLNPNRTPSLNREGWGGSPVGVGLLLGRFPKPFTVSGYYTKGCFCR